MIRPAATRPFATWTTPAALALALAITPVTLGGCQGHGTGTQTIEPSHHLADLGAMALGVVLVAAPLALGLWLGARIRRAMDRRPRRSLGALVALLTVLPMGAGVSAAARFVTVGAWDLLVPGVILGAAFLAGALWPPGPAGRRVAGLAAAATVLSIVAAEAVVRVALPPAPYYPPPHEARLTLPLALRDEACRAIFPDATDILAERTAEARTRPVRVLHVGDSMTAGTGSGREQAFPAVLSTLQPDVGHINAGTVGIGPDAEVLVTEAWTARVPVDLVVLHLFMGNDIHEINRAYPCCDLGPLLSETSGGLVARCPAPRWRFPFGFHLATSPPPYFLRVFAGASALAGYAAVDLVRMAQPLADRTRFDQLAPPPYEGRWRMFGEILARMRDDLRARHLPLLVVVIPSRRTLERALGIPPTNVDMWGSLQAGMEAQRRMVATARAAGLDVLDPWDVFADAMRAGDPERLFAHDCPGDFHLSPAGHALYARWLAPEIARRLSPRR